MVVEVGTPPKNTLPISRYNTRTILDTIYRENAFERVPSSIQSQTFDLVARQSLAWLRPPPTGQPASVDVVNFVAGPLANQRFAHRLDRLWWPRRNKNRIALVAFGSRSGRKSIDLLIASVAFGPLSAIRYDSRFHSDNNLEVRKADLHRRVYERRRV